MIFKEETKTPRDISFWVWVSFRNSFLCLSKHSLRHSTIYRKTRKLVCDQGAELRPFWGHTFGDCNPKCVNNSVLIFFALTEFRAPIKVLAGGRWTLFHLSIHFRLIGVFRDKNAIGMERIEMWVNAAWVWWWLWDKDIRVCSLVQFASAESTISLSPHTIPRSACIISFDLLGLLRAIRVWENIPAVDLNSERGKQNKKCNKNHFQRCVSQIWVKCCQGAFILERPLVALAYK